MYFFNQMCFVWFSSDLCVFLTIIADIILGAMSHMALEQGSGNGQHNSSFMIIIAERTS